MNANVSRNNQIERALIALSLACAFGVFAFAGTVGLKGTHLVAALVAVAIAALLAWLFWRRPFLPYDPEAASPALKVLAGLATVGALVQLVRLCVFIINPAQVGYSLGPVRGPAIPVSHSCVSAYFVAAQAVPTVPDVYSPDLYLLPLERPDAELKPKQIGSFTVDLYEYPPSFLLLPRVLMILAPDFLHFRMVWFGLNGAVMLLGLLVVARFIGPLAGTRALLLAPLVLVSDQTIHTLQIGNLEAMIFAIAMLGMVFLAQERYAAGGALVAYATLSKLFPGLLIVYLVVRRQWRALVWIGGFSAALVLVSLLDTGLDPYRAFLHQLPKLLSGESFAAFRHPFAIALNLSVPGMVFKLKLFGLPGASFGAMRIVGWIYTLIAVAATVVLAKQTLPRNEQPLVWLAILIIASLRSPFLPPYVVIPALWLLTLFAARVAPTVQRLSAVVLGWIVLNGTVLQLHPAPRLISIFTADPRLVSVLALLPQAVMIILVVLVFRRSRESSGTEAVLNNARAFAISD